MIKKAISHFVPITKKIRSAYSGQLEITWINGRKVLETKNANYSYGSAHRVLKFSLDQIKLEGLREVLLLGVGGGSAIKILRETHGYPGNITAIDIDPVIIRIADEEFGITGDGNTRIICSDAMDFIKQENKKYDLIIIDLFIDNKVPGQFLSPEFWTPLLGILAQNGYFIFNSITKTLHSVEPLMKILNQSSVDWKEYTDLLGTNYLLIGRKSAV